MLNKNDILIVSVALNLALLGSSVSLLKARPRPPELTINAAESPKRGSRLAAENSSLGNFVGFRWGQLESTDYRIYIGNLRAVGCPEETVRDIIVAEINKLYAPKFAAVTRPAGQHHYWERPRPGSADMFAKQRELFKERRDLIKALLGIDLDQEYRKKDPATQEADQLYAFLSENNRQQLRALEDKYFDLERRIYANAYGLTTPDDRAALEALRQQKAAEMDALLTPQEQFEYGLRTSPTSRRLQQELDAFQPNEAEFRAIYQAQTALDSARGNGQTTREISDEAEHEFESQLKAALGEQRYAEYHRSKDQGYQFLLKMADRYGLPREVAGQVFDLKQGVDAQTRQVMADSHYGEDQKRAWFQAVRNQTEQTLAGMLGEKGLSLYRDQAGSWLERIGR